MGIEVRHIGSPKLADVEGGSATGGRGARYAFGIVAMAPVPELVAPISAAAGQLIDTLAPWVSEEYNVNFMGYHLPIEERYAKAWSPETYARLAEVRSQYDPEVVFPYGH
jgi:hypothetical protein